MNIQLPIVTLLFAVSVYLPAAEPSPLPEPGPANGGLRLRLLVAPRFDTDKDGYDVRVDLLNTSEHAITLRTKWRNEETGELKEYIDAATSIECVPAVRRWVGGVRESQRTLPQTEHVLKPGTTLTVQWQTQGRHLKNRVAHPHDVQNPEFPVPGLYSVHATLNAITAEGSALLRSNEQLVSVGGSRAMPKSTFGQFLNVAEDGKTAVLSLGSLQQVELGDQFEYFSKREQGKLTVTMVHPNHSVGNLEIRFPTNGTPPLRGTEVTLMQKK